MKQRRVFLQCLLIVALTSRVWKNSQQQPALFSTGDSGHGLRYSFLAGFPQRLTTGQRPRDSVRRTKLQRCSVSHDASTWVEMPSHPENEKVNQVLQRTGDLLKKIQEKAVQPALRPPCSRGHVKSEGQLIGLEDKVFVNNYLNLGAAEVVGFDYDYTLVNYKPALLDLIYDLAKTHLLEEIRYPKSMGKSALKQYDPEFAIRGLAVDIETAWVCKINFRYRVAVAFFGRERVDPQEVKAMYSSKTGAGVVEYEERRARLRPLNDIFSMVEACLLADVVQWFKDNEVPFDPRSVVNDVLQAVGKAHMSGAMHKSVAADLSKYVEPDPERRMRQLLVQLKDVGKKLMVVSNSQFWYVDAGMSHVVGEDWQTFFDVVVASAGKPGFYTQSRPFREVSKRTGRVKFKPIEELEPDEVYCQGSVSELMRLTGWGYGEKSSADSDAGYDGSRIIYMGDSIFADLVEARRQYGWTTGAIIREVSDETKVHRGAAWRQARHTMQALLHCMQLCQEKMRPGGVNDPSRRQHSVHDHKVLDKLESLAAEAVEREEALVNDNFGSIFRTANANNFGSSPSFFARSLSRHADIYTSRVENFRLYSTDHRFYPSSASTRPVHVATHMTDSLLERLRDDNDFDEELEL